MKNDKIARLLVTRKCEKHCDNCCNQLIGTQYKAQYIDNLHPIRLYNIVCVTGGEPLLDWPRTQRILAQLHDRPDRVIYLYTTKCIPFMRNILMMVSGVHFTLHHPLLVDDLNEFYEFQKIISKSWKVFPKTFRLYIDQRIKTPIVIIPSVWSRVEVKPWEVNPPLPKDETLFILDEKYERE